MVEVKAVLFQCDPLSLGVCLKAQQGLQGTLPWTCAEIKGTDSEIIFLFSFVVVFYLSVVF